MTQRSRPQAENINTDPLYIDSGPYSGDQWRERVYAAHTGDENTASQRTRLRGVVPTFDNMLVVTEPVAGTIRVGTGAGIVYGSYLFNSAVVDFSAIGAAPAANPRIDLVCMVENNTNAPVLNGTAANGWIFPTALADYNAAASIPAYSARLVIVKGAEAAGPVEPALDISNTLYMVAIFKYQIAVGGVISLPVDRREFVDCETIVSVNATENDEIQDVLKIGVEVNDGVGAAGLGAGIRFQLENSAGAAEDAGQIAVRYTDAAAADETRLELRLKAGGADNLAAVINSPTGASVDGNARGAGAVDLQQIRTAVTQVASGDYSFVEGRANTASGLHSHAEGYQTTASGDHTHAEGSGTTASDSGAHAEGQASIASGNSSHAEGNTTTASGIFSHAEGEDTIASGRAAHAEGNTTTADGDYSHAGGRQADTNTFDGVFIWADSENAPFTADRPNQFKVRASGSSEFTQNANAAALPVMKLTQVDQDETFIDFVGTSAADQTKSISTVNGDGAVTGPKDFAASAGWAFVGMIKIDVNGAPFWVPYYQPDLA